MTNTPDPGKRIPKSLDTDTQILWKLSLADLAVGGFPSIVVILVTQILVPSSLTVAGVSASTLTIPLLGLALVTGTAVVSLAPTHVTSLEWVSHLVGFYRSDSRFSHEAIKQEMGISRVYPSQDVVERTDGTLLVALTVSSSTMALATDEEWAAKASGFQDFVNTTVDFPIQLYSTTRSFPASEYLARYEDRLTDPDVQANPELATLIEQYVEWYDSELAQRQTTIRDHYVIVPVRPGDVRTGAGGPMGTLVGIPILGPLFRAYTGPSASEQRAAMLDELEARSRRVERGLREIDGCEVTRVSAEEFVAVLAEYWTGESFECDEPDQVIRTIPFVTRDDS